MITRLLGRIAKGAWFLPGFLLWASFPPMAERFDCLIALAPLLWLARRGGTGAMPSPAVVPARPVLCWFLNGCVFWGATLSWMPAIVKNGGPWPLVVLGWAGLAAYCALFFAAFGALDSFYWRWTKRADAYWKRLLGLFVVEPVLWCGLELVRSRFLGGFAWNQLGVTLANGGFGSPAALGGVYLLSAVVILINGTIASIAERVLAPVLDRYAQKTAPNWVRSVETLIPFLIIWGIFTVAQTEDARRGTRDGSVAEGTGRETRDAGTVRVALVQRNASCCFRGREEKPLPVYERLLANVATLGPDLVVLSESALSEFGELDRIGAAHFAKFVCDKTGAALLAGGSRSDGSRLFNSAALYLPNDPRGLVEPQVYDKVHLVPFGEFIPGDKLFPVLQKLAPVGSCTPGELKLLSLPIPDSGLQTPKPVCEAQGTIPLGVAICFEDTDSAQVRALARMGARALVFITNDSWFSESGEAVQHAWQAVARAVETGLPVVRVGNSGVTGVIRPDGRAEWLVGADGSPLVDARGTMFEKLQVRGVGEGLTAYVSLGDWPLGIAFALLILGLIVIKYLTIYEERRTLSM